ncbi:19039_t:CDS:2, partial [Racocetra persica]
IEMVVHNGHAFSRNHHFPRDRMVEYYNNNAWNTINKALQEDGHTFRTWIKHTDIVKACKELFEDVVDWQLWEGIISEEKEQEFLESLKIVELAEQVFGANYAGSKLANEINNWHLTPASVHENIKQSCVEYGYGGRWNASNYQVGEVVYIDMKKCYPASMHGQGECSPWFKRVGHPTHHLVRVAVNRELLQDDITRFAGEGCEKVKGWTPIVLLRYLLETGKFMQRNKVEEKHLTHRVVIDEGKLDFLIQDCIKEGTYA